MRFTCFMDTEGCLHHTEEKASVKMGIKELQGSREWCMGSEKQE